MAKSLDYNATKTPQSGSKPPHQQPANPTTANTIPGVKKNWKSTPASNKPVDGGVEDCKY
jgi:hypothetical protein